jgi:hypothetical protein
VIRFGLFGAAGLLAGGVLVSGQVPASIPAPRGGSGGSITGAFEGWYYNPDGSRSFLVGYYNRNTQQELDIPIGPNNKIEPGGPDRGQPTHFMTGRQWGMFIVPVPRDFKDSDSYVWTLTANNQTTSIPLRVHADYVMSPFKEIAVGNTPPQIRFEENGMATQGPLANLETAASRTASMASPFAITMWTADDVKYTSGTNAPMSAARPPVVARWSKYRGPGAVTFDKARPEVEKLSSSGTPGTTAGGSFTGRATTHVKFSEPGDYVLHLIANDYSGDGGGGFGCCWSTALLKVSVKP